MENKRILISGAGIAGLCLAYWLQKYGFEPTVVEQAPKLREGGYVIDFLGSGYDVAEKMGIIPDLEKVDVKIKKVVFINKDGKRKGGLDAFRIRKMVGGRFLNVLRSGLARVMAEHLDKNTEFIFGDSISKIEDLPDGVNVSFRSGKERRFDLVIGADGLHSNVRKLVFGDESQFIKFFGYYASSFTIEDYLHPENAFVTYTVPGRQANVYALEGNKLTALFLFASPELGYDHHDAARQKEILRSEFNDAGWECHNLLTKMDEATDFYFDSVSQIRMDHWSSGRVSLVGDACDAPSLLSGQGSTLAMTAAYILAGELKAAKGDHRVAFSRYETEFRPLITHKQRNAKSFAKSFIPNSRFGIWLRNSFTGLMLSSLAAKWLVKKYMTDDIVLKEY